MTQEEYLKACDRAEELTKRFKAIQIEMQVNSFELALAIDVMYGAARIEFKDDFLVIDLISKRIN
jgi:hypothetical protein